jgi:hypothetical protein
MRTFLLVVSVLILGACVVGGMMWLALQRAPSPIPKTKWVTLENPCQPTNLLVVARGSPSQFWFRVRGHIEGTADLFVSEPGWSGGAHPGDSNHITGGYVDWSVGRDYFDDSAVFYYRPANVKTGLLVIEYSFR